MSNESVWQGRVDAEDGARGLRWHHVVRPLGAESNGVALIGFASDEGVRRNRGRVGAAQGPLALRRALAGLAYHAREGRPLLDAGDVECRDADLESAQAALAMRIDALLGAGHFPVVLGGGHEVAFGSFQGIARRYARDPRMARYGIINFDAHFDLRRSPARGIGTSGTPFLQIHDALAADGFSFNYLCLGVSRASNTRALFETAAACRVEYVLDEDLIWPEWEEICLRIDEFLARVDLVHVSICLDALPASVAPGVSAPAARGIPPDLFFAMLSHVLDRVGHGERDSRLVLAEVAELSPPHDHEGMTARLAARVVHDLCAPLL